MHTTWDDTGFEQVEEFDLTTDQLLLRKVRKAAMAGRESKWEIEVGEDAAAQRAGEEMLIAASQDQPTIVRRDTQECFQWRVRNIPYPVETYAVTAEAEANQLVIRTSNKKYFKRINIPDLDRHGIPIDASGISFTHCNRTLVVSLQKPDFILQVRCCSHPRAKSHSPVAECVCFDCGFSGSVFTSRWKYAAIWGALDLILGCFACVSPRFCARPGRWRSSLEMGEGQPGWMDGNRV